MLLFACLCLFRVLGYPPKSPSRVLVLCHIVSSSGVSEVSFPSMLVTSHAPLKGPIAGEIVVFKVFGVP